MNIGQHTIGYFDNGYTVLDGILSDELAEDIATRLARHRHDPTVTVRQELEAKPGQAFGSPKSHTMFLLPGLQVVAPELIGAYHALVPLVEAIVGRDVILSPYELSPVLAKVHTHGDFHGEHFDTQPVTALLYLTGGAATELHDLRGERASVEPYPGSLLLMQGRRCLHWVPAHDETLHGAYRITVPMNYYFPDDTYRPVSDQEAFAMGRVDPA